MFNMQHILYMAVSFGATAILLIALRLLVKTDRTKNRILKIAAIITVVIHYSNIWVNYFANGGTATVENSHILPVYPCNVVMWMLLAAALIQNKKRLIFRLLSEFCFYGGTICGVLGIVLNVNFGNNPTLADFEILKGLLSHSTMLFGCLYMLVGGYIRIRVFNVLSLLFGLSSFVICGKLVNSLYEHFGMTPPDGMWLESNPYFTTSPMKLGLLAVGVMFIILHLWELHLPKEQRWYKHLHRRKKHERIIY